MEQTPRTSFIPKQAPGEAPRHQRRTFNVLSFIAMVIFLASLALALFVFFYGRYSDDQLVARKAELADLRNSFSATDVASVRALERRLNAAQGLLDGHIALSRVFDALEAQTQESAQISSFDYTRLPSGSAEVKLEGKASAFNTVALQERRFLDERSFAPGSVIFSNLNVSPSDNGNNETVTFTVSADLDRTSVLYAGQVQESTTEASDAVMMETETTNSATDTVTTESETNATP